MLLLALLVVFFPPPSLAAASAGAVRFVAGSASEGAQAIKVGDAVHVGETLRTGPKSQLRVVLEGGIAIQLGPDSIAKLEHEAGKPPTIELLQGNLLTTIKKGPAGMSASRFRVKTKSASLVSGGTTFFTKLEKDGRTFLCVCFGTVNAAWNQGKRNVTGQHHNVAAWILSGARFMPVAPRGFEHPDTDIAALGKLL